MWSSPEAICSDGCFPSESPYSFHFLVSWSTPTSHGIRAQSIMLEPTLMGSCASTPSTNFWEYNIVVPPMLVA